MTGLQHREAKPNLLLDEDHVSFHPYNFTVLVWGRREGQRAGGSLEQPAQWERKRAGARGWAGLCVLCSGDAWPAQCAPVVVPEQRPCPQPYASPSFADARNSEVRSPILLSGRVLLCFCSLEDTALSSGPEVWPVQFSRVAQWWRCLSTHWVGWDCAHGHLSGPLCSLWDTPSWVPFLKQSKNSPSWKSDFWKR